jgi:hypothetical protein
MNKQMGKLIPIFSSTVDPSSMVFLSSWLRLGDLDPDRVAMLVSIHLRLDTKGIRANKRQRREKYPVKDDRCLLSVTYSKVKRS